MSINHEATVVAFAFGNKSEREGIRVTLTDRVMAAVKAGDMVEAKRVSDLIEGLVEAADGIAADYEAAERVATMRVALANAEANLSDAARTLVEAETVGVNERLLARFEGVNVTRTAVSSDGAKRAGSDEPKGSVKEALVAYLATRPVGEWSTITQAGKWITENGAEFGYTPNYVVSGGAILARNGANERSAAWRAEHNIEFDRVEMGAPAPQWAVRRTA